MRSDLQIGEIRKHPARGRVQLVSFDTSHGSARYFDMERGHEMPCALAFWQGLPDWPEEQEYPVERRERE